MENSTPSGRSYWDLLAAARRFLDAGDFSRAERDYELARAGRLQSPGRVFLTEKITDGLASLFRGRGRQESFPGRWERRTAEFRRDFLAEGELVVRNAVRLAELRPEDDADSNQPILEAALFLVGRSRIFSEEPSSAVPLLKGLFRTAGKTGRPFDAQLIRHDIPLTEEDRLWLARKGPAILEEFVASGVLEPGSAESENWVRIILQLLHPRYFGSTGRLEEERAWLEAVTTDRLLGRTDESVDLYRLYLQVNPEPGGRADEARVRLLELLANSEDIHFHVPRYDQALGAMQAAGLATGSAVAGRYELALARIEYRRPDPEPGTVGQAWASAGLEPDGRVAVVFWWRDEPRDVAFWAAGDDPEPMVRFLEPCAGRIVATDPAVVEAVGPSWQEVPAPWSVRDFAEAFLEPFLPDTGLDDDTFLKTGLGESGPWRRSWRSDLGHFLLDPPRRSALLETWQGRPASGALLGGLVWLAVLARITGSDPALRAGIGEMARRGDAAAGFLYDFLNLDRGLGQTMDSSFEPWTLPLLWTRPDPFGWSVGTAAGGLPGQPGGQDSQPRPDLGRNDLAIVTTGDPGSVLAAWGDGSQKWRIVLDRLDRLAALARVAAGAIGPVTLIPPGGRVHSLRACLDLLEKMLTREGRPAGRVEGLLPIFHWIRLVETHNGDVLDFLQVRPRPGIRVPLFESYRQLVGDLQLVEPVLDPPAAEDPWSVQFSQRVRRAGLVAGLADSLSLDPGRLDSLWGVYEGSDASWVFLDSAAVHWRLFAKQGLGVQELHALLHSRGGRHLSLLVGAVWMRSELEGLLGTWLGVFGSPYCLALTNTHPPLLRLVDHGVAPDAIHQAVEAHAAPVAQVAESLDLAGDGTVLLPATGTQAELWHRIAAGKIPLGKPGWHYLDPAADDVSAPAGGDDPGSRGLLLVPVLESLSGGMVPLAQEDTVGGWVRADRDRAEYLAWRRRLCGLEIAALLAGPWETVEIMDTRWWRILEEDAQANSSGTDPVVPWNGERALTLAAPVGSRLFNLPGLGAGKGRTIHPNTLETVRQWLAGRIAVDATPVGNEKQADESGRVRVSLRNVGDLWPRLVGPVARDWEQGRLQRWLLLVGEQVPEEAAHVVAAGFSPGISVWSAERIGGRPAPVLWCRPADLEDPELRLFLNRDTPATVLALDVQDWLPSVSRTGQRGATALRTLLDCPAERLVLQAAVLDQPWLAFLARETGARIESQEGRGAAVGAGLRSGACDLFPAPEDDEVILDGGRAVVPRAVVRRMRRLLAELRPALRMGREPATETGPDGIPPDRQLVSLDRLGVLAGLSPTHVASSFRLLRWVARLSGDSLSDAEAQVSAGESASGHSLLIPGRFAELEHVLVRMEEQIPVLFPLLLGPGTPGLLTWFDLEFPPVQLDPEELDLLDRFLAEIACTIGGKLGLVYSCPRGTLNSTRRLIGTTLPAGEVVGNLCRELAVFRSRLNEVMSSAVETGEGFLVETGLAELRDEERRFLALGSGLGLWTWTGPAGERTLHLVDLLTTAESETVRQGETAWDLLAEELALAFRSTVPAANDPPEPDLPAAREGHRLVTGIRSLLPRADKGEESKEVTERVATLAHPDSGPGLLVVSGLVGTGRHEALVRGLGRSRDLAGEQGEITVFCPDAAAAAHFMQQWSAICPWQRAPEIRVAGPGHDPSGPGRNPKTRGRGSDAVIVMLEIQRFEPETRYRIAHLGRGRKLLMSTDPAAAVEPWEHLFLTVPGASEVVSLQAQRLVSRKVWSEVRLLLPDNLRGKGHSQGPRKGNISAVYAVNLDQCLARIIEEVETGSLPGRLRLVGPLASDLAFLAASLRDRGWLAVAEEELDALHLPGPREFLAAATGYLGRSGLLTRLFSTGESGPDVGEDGAAVNLPADPDEILLRFLGPEARNKLDPWREKCLDLDPRTTCGEFYREMEIWPWARSVLADAAAALRAADTVARWENMPVTGLVGDPLWESWFYSVRDDLGLSGAIRRRPLVTLAAAGQASGPPVRAGVYLCLGSELPRQHYGVLSRMTEDVLILYKEQSPLAHGASG